MLVEINRRGYCNIMPILKAIINKCQHEIWNYTFEIDIATTKDDQQNTLLHPPELVNLNYIRLLDLGLYIQWSNHHQVLMFANWLWYKLWFLFVCFECQWSTVVLAIVSDNEVQMIWNLNELFRERKRVGQQNYNVYVMLIIGSFGFCVQKFWQKMA